jgi:hypothetical protein
MINPFFLVNSIYVLSRLIGEEAFRR